MTMAILKIVEYTQLAGLIDVIHDVESVQMVTGTLAVFSAFGWLSPNLAWKKKLS